MLSFLYICSEPDPSLEFGNGCRIDQLSKWEELPKCAISFMQIAMFVVPLMQAGVESFSTPL